MISKQQIKFIRSLHLKKFRKQNGMFIAEGAKLVHELLRSSLTIHKIYALPSWMAEQTDLPDTGIIEEINEKELDQVSELSTPNEVLAVVKTPELPPYQQEDITLCLESIRDPGNLGTLIRIADWYGLKQIICSEDCTDCFASKTVQSSMGSIFRVNVIYTDLTSFFRERELPIYAAALERSENLHQFTKFGKGFLLIGNESNGLSEELLEMSNFRLHIPRFGQAESLNAAVAAGIFIDTFKRNLT